MNQNKNVKSNKRMIKRKKRQIKKRMPNNRTKRANVIRGRKIAAASAAGFRKKFNVLRQNGNSVRVSGRDLIYSIPDDLTSPIQDTNVITVIPANPAYWKGTRIAALASGYQNYRPIMFKITYIPMCAVTQQGNVIGGTIWDDGIDNDNLQQSLRTSNGGFLTQCYVPHTTRIRPKSNLQFNLYRMGGEFSTTSNPFIFIALAIGCKNTSNQRIIPGYFYVTWSFELKNPIGSINTYNNSSLITYSQLQPEMNTTIININPNSEVPFGAYIDVEEEDSTNSCYYNGTKVQILNNTPIWAFTSVSKPSTTKFLNKLPIYYTSLTTEELQISANTYQAYLVDQGTSYKIILIDGIIPSNTVYKADYGDNPVFIINDKTQNFGIRSSSVYETFGVYEDGQNQGSKQIKTIEFNAPKNLYTISLGTRKVKNEDDEAKIFIDQISHIKID